jgi:Uncharacterized protein family UPF0029
LRTDAMHPCSTPTPLSYTVRRAASETTLVSDQCELCMRGIPQSRIWDDGEPRGTAGSPILTAISGEGFDHVCVLVTRCTFCIVACAAPSGLMPAHRAQKWPASQLGIDDHMSLVCSSATSNYAMSCR